ncbi:MAG: A/G-specific adenine glycosylase [Myxococcales bacterium]|nr:A/G-specific adenine glycosylase [Myxococcales bacterium]
MRAPPGAEPPALAPAAATARALLAWYTHAGRRLPWRAVPGGPLPDPYGVLVSEFMLQQTRVETVRAPWARWMARWPDFSSLANATLDAVLAQWTGLGYYARARHLHRLAQTVVRDHGGALPRAQAALAALPGLGPYTQGALRSVAFGEPAALVDGNVARVLARWHAVQVDVRQGAGRRAVWAAAQAWMDVPEASAHPGDWNQALMELGAVVCVPGAPRCGACPVAAACRAHAEGRELDLPVRVRPPAPRVVAACYAVLTRTVATADADSGDQEVLVGQRPAQGRWAGLWEPPGCEGPDAHDRLHAWLGAAGCDSPRALGSLVHVLTHRRYEVQGWAAAAGSADLACLGYVAQRWMPVAAALGITAGLSKLGQRLVELAAAPAPSPRPARARATPAEKG